VQTLSGVSREGSVPTRYKSFSGGEGIRRDIITRGESCVGHKTKECDLG